MSIKKITLEKEPDWYFKVIGMLQHNYAFIHEEQHGIVMVYFLHERGSTLNFTFFESTEIDGDGDRDLPNIVDSFEFPNQRSAHLALKRNHFKFITEASKYLDLSGCPSGQTFIDARLSEPGIYSKKDEYWIK